MLIKFIVFIFLLTGSTFLSAQRSIHTGSNGLFFHIGYGYHLPGADLKDRYGSNSSIGSSLEWKFKNDFFVGGNFSYIFGRNIKEFPISNLYNSKNELIGTDNHLAVITLSERGFLLSGNVGKLIPINKVPEAFIKISIGGGAMQHKLRIVDDYAVVTQILGDYQKGYDRLTNGLMLNEFIGFQWLSQNKRINLSLGMQLNQGFTKSVRKFNYDTRTIDDGSRIDLLNGFVVSWILPFYFNEPDIEIIY